MRAPGSLHDNCSEALVKSVATEMISNGMRDAGYTHINLDDCWGATDLEGNRADHGRYTWSPKRFPSGIPALTSWLHARGFLFGLYTSSGNATCSSGGRAGVVPGSCQSDDPLAGEKDCEFDQDAATFASWGVDYVKLDWCIKTVPLRTNAVRERRTALMAAAMNKTGRAMWLTFHCTYAGKGSTGRQPVFEPWCAEDGNSWRIGPDHHDNWDSLENIIDILGTQAEHGRPFRWSDPDFLMTGGAGCNKMDAGKRCPGMSDTEYRTEFSLWVMGAASMIVSTDLRNMSSFMKGTLMHKDMLAIHQDPMGIAGGLVLNVTDGVGCSDVHQTHKGRRSAACQMWARPLSGGRWAMALYNRNNASATITGLFSALPPQPARTILGVNSRAGTAPSTFHVRDVWGEKDLGSHTDQLAQNVSGHATVVFLLSP